jgi:hypothetical protein
MMFMYKLFQKFMIDPEVMSRMHASRTPLAFMSPMLESFFVDVRGNKFEGQF